MERSSREAPSGVLALIFGGGGSNGDPHTLYFTDRLNGGDDGLFAALTPSIPEPSTWALMLVGLAGLGFAGYGRARAGRGTLSFSRLMTAVRATRRPVVS
jgi:hypothetical protein